MHNINPLKVDELVSCVFDSCDESMSNFQADFSQGVLSICEHLRDGWSGFLKFDNHANADEQHNYLTANIYMLVESQFTSLKLLAGGFVAPSGNQLRVSIEALATSALLSQRGELLVQKNRPNWKPRNYFADYKKGKHWVFPMKSLQILEANNDRIKLTGQALSMLSSIRKLYNQYSHASFLTLGAGIVNPEKLRIGGGYDREQKYIYENEMAIRQDLISKTPSYISGLYEKSVAKP